MADKGIGIEHCEKHGDYFKDVEDSPCPSCEDEEEEEEEEYDLDTCGCSDPGCPCTGPKRGGPP